MRCLLVILLFSTAVYSQNNIAPFSTNFLTNIMGSFRGPDAMNVSQFLSTFQMPDCMKKCMPEMDGIVQLFGTSTDPTTMSNLCSGLHSSSSCAVEAGCSKVFVDAASSAFQFMCIDNINTMGETLACARDAADDLHVECESHCAVQKNLLKQAAGHNIEDAFQVKNMCNSSLCLLHCFKDRLQQKCKTSERNLIDTVISSVMRGEGHGFEDVLSWLVPEKCNAEQLKFSLPNEVPSSGVPMSVGKTVSLIQADSKSDNGTLQPVETALLIDGEVRTLQCQLFDWHRQAVPTPDFESLAKIMAAQLLPFSYPKDKRSNKVQPDNKTSDEKEKIRKQKVDVALPDVSKPSNTVESPVWKGEGGELEVPSNDVGVTMGVMVFVVAVAYWLWKSLDSE